jgi:hypothetical protein
MLFLPCSLYSQSFIQGGGVSLLASSSGLGLEFSWQKPSSPNLRYRLGYTYFEFLKTQRINMEKQKNIDLTPQLRKQVLYGVVDYFPFKKKRWHVSAGLAYNIKDQYQFKANTETGVIFGGIEIYAEDFGTIKGDIRWSKLMPYLGIGYVANLYKDKVLLGIDIGSYYMGSPKLNLSYEGFLETTTLDEEIPKIEHNLRGYSYYPNIAFTLGYRF